MGACVCTHPPEVLAVGVSWDAVGCVDLAHQGTEASPFGDVLSAAHAGHLHEDAQKCYTTEEDGRFVHSLKTTKAYSYVHL